LMGNEPQHGSWYPSADLFTLSHRRGLVVSLVPRLGISGVVEVVTSPVKDPVQTFLDVELRTAVSTPLAWRRPIPSVTHGNAFVLAPIPLSKHNHQAVTFSASTHQCNHDFRGVNTFFGEISKNLLTRQQRCGILWV